MISSQYTFHDSDFEEFVKHGLLKEIDRQLLEGIGYQFLNQMKNDKKTYGVRLKEVLGGPIVGQGKELRYTLEFEPSRTINVVEYVAEIQEFKDIPCTIETLFQSFGKLIKTLIPF